MQINLVLMKLCNTVINTYIVLRVINSCFDLLKYSPVRYSKTAIPSSLLILQITAAVRNTQSRDISENIYTCCIRFLIHSFLPIDSPNYSYVNITPSELPNCYLYSRRDSHVTRHRDVWKYFICFLYIMSTSNNIKNRCSICKSDLKKGKFTTQRV